MFNIKFKTYEFKTVEDLKTLIKENPQILKEKNNFGKNIFNFVCFEGNLEFVKQISELVNDMDIIKNCENVGSDSYLNAASSGHVNIMEYLESRHNWNVHTTNSNINDAYLIAVFYGHINVMEYLETKYNCDHKVKNKYGRNALFYVKRNGKKKVIEHIEKLSNPISNDVSELFSDFELNIRKSLQKYEKKIERLEKDKTIKKLKDQLEKIQSLLFSTEKK